MDVFKSARILILHMVGYIYANCVLCYFVFTLFTCMRFQFLKFCLQQGRDFALDACKRTFMTVPAERTTGSTANLLTNLDLLLLTVTEKVRSNKVLL